MAECNGFTLSRRGYNCGEVDDFVVQTQRGEKELRDSYAALQEKYDALCEENSRLAKERERVSSDCTTLALALKQLREGADENGTSYKEKYETALAELESMKAIVIDDGYRAKYEQAQAELEQLRADGIAAQAEIDSLRAMPAKSEEVTPEPVEYGEAASKMVTEVAEVVQKLEKDARRKAEAITLSAKLEQAQAQLIRSRVTQEVRSLIEMLECYLREHPEEAEKQDK